MAHPNEDLLRGGYEAFTAGDIEKVLAIFADDIAWHVPGENQLAGDYHGHQEVVGFFGKLIEITGGTFRLDVHDILANDKHGAVIVTAYGERPGNTLEAREVHVWHFADGKATEFWSPSDQQRQIDFFFS